MVLAAIHRLAGKNLSRVSGSSRELALQTKDILQDLIDGWTAQASVERNQTEQFRIETQLEAMNPKALFRSLFVFWFTEYHWFLYSFKRDHPSKSQAIRAMSFVAFTLLLFRPMTRPQFLTLLSATDVTARLTKTAGTGSALLLFAAAHKTASSYGCVLARYASADVQGILRLYLKDIRPVILKSSAWIGTQDQLFPASIQSRLSSYFRTLEIVDFTPGSIRSAFSNYIDMLPSTHSMYTHRHALQSTAAHVADAGSSVVLRHYALNNKVAMETKLWSLVVLDFVKPVFSECREIVLDVSDLFVDMSTSVDDTDDDPLFDPATYEADGSPAELGNLYRLPMSTKKRKNKRKRNHATASSPSVLLPQQCVVDLTRKDLPGPLRLLLKSELAGWFRENFLMSTEFVQTKLFNFLRTQWAHVFETPFDVNSREVTRISKLCRDYALRNLKNWRNRLPLQDFVDTLLESKVTVTIAVIKQVVSFSTLSQSVKTHVAFTVSKITRVSPSFLGIFRKNIEQAYLCTVKKQLLSESFSLQSDDSGLFAGYLVWKKSGFAVNPYHVPEVMESDVERVPVFAFQPKLKSPAKKKIKRV
jgi:hypothetical protein